ncbi:hypothetical protein [Streptomyces sp. NPDC005408]|uniref:hypothetical protein n=1 Tax=Streptomyces sp. NPDC005408 TaxID=3155341 RepID=UPI0033BEEC4E
MAPPASASAAGTGGTAEPAAGRHCVVRLSQGNQMSCFATFSAAIAAATGGKVTNAPADPGSAMADPAFAAQLDESAAKRPSSAPRSTATTPGNTVIGIEYEHIGFAGSTFVLTSDYGCTPDLDYAEWEYTFWRTSWSDRISSFRTYAGCRANHFDGPFYDGAQTGYQVSQYYIGEPMNDRTTSIRWS